MQQISEVAEPAEERLDARVLAVIRSFAKSTARTVTSGGRRGVESVDEGLERTARSFHRRLVNEAIADPRPVPDRTALLQALTAEKASSVFGGGATAALMVRTVMKRLGPLKIIARRTPWLAAASAVPAAYASLSHGADEVGWVASYLVHRSHQAGVDPSPDRVLRVTVQLLQRDRVDAEREPPHRDLVTSLIWRAVKAVLPFTHAGRTKHAKKLVDAAAAVDVHTLRQL